MDPRNIPTKVRGRMARRLELRRASRTARSHRDRLDEVERYCFFLGWGRSGTTITAQLLNANKDVVIAHQWHALQWLERGASREQLYGGLLHTDQQFSEHLRSRISGYQYKVPGQWQGRADRLRVIGDKDASAATNALHRRPELLDTLRQTVGVPLRVVCVVRNPFDTATTMAKRNERTLAQGVATYLRRAGHVARIRASLTAEELIDVRHEELVADPKAELARLCGRLGVDAGADYLEACAGVVFPAPRRTRDNETWTPELRAMLEDAIATYPLLSGYRFD